MKFDCWCMCCCGCGRPVLVLADYELALICIKKFLRMYCRICLLFSYHRRRLYVGTYGTSPPPRNGKNCCRKMMLFPKVLFLATTFPKIVKNSMFLLNFYQKFSKISQNFPTIRVFRPNARKINAWLVVLKYRASASTRASHQGRSRGSRVT